MIIKKYISIFIALLFTSGCIANESKIYPIYNDLEEISFDVVQKKIILDADLPENINELIFMWFNKKVKVDGFDGDMTFTVSEYIQEITNISDGKRVEVSLAFNILLNKSSSNQTKKIDGRVSSFGSLTGNFSLKDFDIIIQNTQSDLILRLAKDLKSKI